MKYPVFALVLLALAVVPSDAFYCYVSQATDGDGKLGRNAEHQFCPFQSCVAYRIDYGSVSYFQRSCMKKMDGYDDLCEYIEQYGGKACKSCNWFPLCNSGDIETAGNTAQEE